ncbi:hypothetical protein DV736_g383, partial [Chaetothyriales sp. CBS 134916]
MADETCCSCNEPLYIEIDLDSDVEDSKAPVSLETIPDDVQLICGCHYHWECFMEAYTITKCPYCQQDISSLSPSGQQQVICTIRNEGGVQEHFDILPSATEEAYLRTYPEEREGHAFLSFCRDGDVDAIVHMIKYVGGLDDSDDEDEGEAGVSVSELLRYSGTFEGIDGSGLHVAIRYRREEVAWLLLVLASSLSWSEFPPVVLQAMSSLRLTKEDRQPGIDIRAIKDVSGRTAKSLAQEVGGVWDRWISAGRLD